MPSQPLSASITQQLLDSLGHSPNKKLGQNFLIDGNIVRKSLSLANVQASDHIVEIGPGLGTLTRTLLSTGAHVYAVEYDKRLYQNLNNTLTEEYSEHFHLMQGDAVDFPIGSYPKTSAAPFKIVANLPYAIATPWLEKVLSGPLPECMVLMLQKETADRFTATHGSKIYGSISILLEGSYTRIPGHKVARQCFHPVPGVDSVLLNLKRKEKPHCFSRLTKNIIRDFFTQRRKQIGSLARKHSEKDKLAPWLKELEALDIPLNTRPEAIPYSGWLKLDLVLKD